MATSDAELARLGGLAVGDGDHAVARPLEHGAHELADPGVVLRHEDGLVAARHGSGYRLVLWVLGSVA